MKSYKNFGDRSRDSKGSHRNFDRKERFEIKQSRPAFGRSSNRESGFELHEVTCDKCGRKCDIPFKPKTNKPVYCRSCFRKDNSREEKQNHVKRFEEEFHSENKSRYQDSIKGATHETSDLDMINKKLDKIMRALNID